MNKRKYKHPHITKIEVYTEGSIAIASVMIKPGGTNNDFPQIIEENLQTKDEEWILD